MAGEKDTIEVETMAHLLAVLKDLRWAYMKVDSRVE